MMSPKEKYEARKAARKVYSTDESFQEKRERDEADMHLLFERFVLAVESLALSAEHMAALSSRDGGRDAG